MINDNPHADLNPTPKQSTEFNYTGNIFYLDFLHSWNYTTNRSSFPSQGFATCYYATPKNEK